MISCSEVPMTPKDFSCLSRFYEFHFFYNKKKKEKRDKYFSPLHLSKVHYLEVFQNYFMHSKNCIIFVFALVFRQAELTGEDLDTLALRIMRPNFHAP